MNLKFGNKPCCNRRNVNCIYCKCKITRGTNLNDLNKSIDDVISNVDLLTKEITIIDDKINEELDNYKFNIEPELIKNETIIEKYIDTQILIKNKENNEQLIEKFTCDIENTKDTIIPKNEQATLTSIMSEKINEGILAADILLHKADELSGSRNENSAKDNES